MLSWRFCGGTAQSGSARMGGLLRPVLSVEMPGYSGPLPHRNSGEVGDEKIQEIPGKVGLRVSLAGTHRGQRQPALLSLEFGIKTNRLDGKSRMSRETQVRFCEGVRVKSPRATRHYDPPRNQSDRSVVGFACLSVSNWFHAAPAEASVRIVCPVLLLSS